MMMNIRYYLYAEWISTTDYAVLSLITGSDNQLSVKHNFNPSINQYTCEISIVQLANANQNV